jgi:hypothetical protein
VALRRILAIKLQAATILRMNAVLGTNVHHHASAFAAPAVAARPQSAALAPAPQQQQQEVVGGGQPTRRKGDGSESFQRPSPGDSNTSETTASPSARVCHEVLCPAS